MTKPLVSLVVFALVVVLCAPPVSAQIQDAAQQGCINTLNKAGAKLAATQGKESSACIKNAGKGKEPNAQACLTADSKLKVSKAAGKVADGDDKKCGTAPSFGRASVGQITSAAVGEELALTLDVFGADLTAAIILASVDKTGAGCQAAVSKAHEKLAATKIKSFLKCKKDGLKAGTLISEAGLQACITAIASDAKVISATSKLASAITKKCPGVVFDTVFPGDCVGAGDFAACVDEQVECRVCLLLDAMDNVEVDCDLFDNAAADASCANVPSTTTTTTSTTTTVPPTTTTLPPGPDWGLDCFATTDCGPSFCASPGTTCQCGAFLGSVGLPPPAAMCFYDCMDMTLMDVTDCRDACGGAAAPPCDTSTAGAGGYPGVVTGAGKCEPTGFAAGVTLGGTAGLFKRILVDFTVPIDEASLFSAPPPPCAGACPSPGSDCDAGSPYPSSPLADVFRLQIGAAAPAMEVCDRLGVGVTACKYSATGYALVVASPICTPAPVDLSLFMSCHVSSGGGSSFLHFSSGDFFSIGSWPP